MSAETASRPVGKNEPHSAAQRSHDLIDPAALMRIKSLELRAKRVVEGFCAGLNRSPHHGFSVEFTEYRQYTPGDDLRYMDWRLYARSDRYYVKRFEDETNLRCHLIVDSSRSMEFGSLPYTKADYAKTLACTLAFFLSLQRDAVGLITFGEQVQEIVPARYRVGHLRRLLVALEKSAGGKTTALAPPLDEAAQRISKRGILVLISDLLAPLDELKGRLGCLGAHGHEIVVFQVLDPAEWDFELSQPTLLHDMESRREIYVEPRTARRSYRAKLRAHVDAVRGICDEFGASYRTFLTIVPLEHALSEFLHSRMRKVARTTPYAVRTRRTAD